MIIAKITSGLGNQLFQYAIGRELALRNKTILKLDISFFGSQNLRSFKLSQFKIDSPIANDDDVNRYTAAYLSQSLNRRVQRKLRKFFPLPKTYYAEKEWWVYEEGLFDVKDHTYVDGYWQHYKYYQNLHPQILSELTLKDNVNIHGLLQLPLNTELISVHIRRGDYVTDSAASMMGVLPIAYYQNALELIYSKINNPTFCFFSDDIPWVKTTFQHVKNSYFIEGFKDYEDLSLMSQCQHNIIANSSFSWWGAFLNSNVNKMVIAPQKWVADSERNKKVEIQLPNWIKI